MINSDYLNTLFEYRDGKLFWKIARSSRVRVGQEAGCVNQRGYKHIRIDGNLYLAHRIIYLMIHKHLPTYLDHRDGNKLNNTIENLRPATKDENNRSTKISKRNTSGYKGVTLHKQTNKWKAQLCYDKINHHLGLFNTKEEAAKRVKEERSKLHGEFCKHE